MGPKLKKPPKNSFSFFLDKYVEMERKKRRSISKKIAAEECAPLWKRLSKEEKAGYEEMAKLNKTKEKHNMSNKFTSEGISYAEKLKQEEEENAAQNMMEFEIRDTCMRLMSSSTLKTHLFYIIHCNYYCRTEEGIYVPAELAIVEFNLLEGVRDHYHVLIDPGSIPVGYAFEAIRTSEEIHGLPSPPYEVGEDDYSKIFREIEKFLEKGLMPNGRLPPLYTIENNLRASDNVMKVIGESVYDEDVKVFRVYPLEKLFFELKNRCATDEALGFPVIANAENEITKDVFCYTLGISCDFHQSDGEKYHNCSLSIVRRMVYTICDHCCQLLDIPLIPGKHSQLYADTTRSSVRGSVACASDIVSSRTSKTSSLAGDRDHDFDEVSSYVGSIATSRRSDMPGSDMYEKQEKDLEPLKRPKTRAKTFYTPSEASDVVSEADTLTGDLDRVTVNAEDDTDDDINMICVGRGSRLKKPAPFVGRKGIGRGTSLHS